MNKIRLAFEKNTHYKKGEKKHEDHIERRRSKRI